MKIKGLRRFLFTVFCVCLLGTGLSIVQPAYARSIYNVELQEGTYRTQFQPGEEPTLVGATLLVTDNTGLSSVIVTEDMMLSTMTFSVQPMVSALMTECVEKDGEFYLPAQKTLSLIYEGFIVSQDVNAFEYVNFLIWNTPGPNYGKLRNYSGDATIVKIPEEIQGIPVTGILGTPIAISGNSSMEEIVFPSTLTSIDTKGISNCFNLAKLSWEPSLLPLTIPTQAISIDDRAIVNPEEKSKLKTIDLPARIISLSTTAFNCFQYEEVIIQSGNSNYHSGSGAYSGIVYPKGVSSEQERCSNAYILPPKKQTYKVIFDCNGFGNGFEGGATTKAVEYPATAAVDLWPSSEMTDPTMEFVGWYYNAECTSPATNVTMPVGDLSLYAKWAPQSVPSFTMKLNFQNSQSFEEVTLPRNNDLNLSKPTKTGYTFAGWFTTSSCACNNCGSQKCAEFGCKLTDCYGQCSSCEAKRITNAEGFGIYKPEYDLIDYLEVYARWNPKTYTIIFNYHLDNTNGLQPNIVVTYGETYSFPGNLSKTGHTFQGWYAGTDGTGYKYTGSNGAGIGNWGLGIGIWGEDILSGEKTIHAYFTAKDSYSIEYRYNRYAGDSKTDTKANITYGTNVSLLKDPGLSDNGRKFKYWKLDGVQLAGDLLYNYDKNIILTAEWELLPITIKYKDSDGNTLTGLSPSQFYIDAGVNLPTGGNILVGRIVTGWQLDSIGSIGTTITKEMNLGIGTSTEIILFAVVSAKSIKITYAYQAFEPGTVNNSRLEDNLTYGKTINLPQPQFTNGGNNNFTLLGYQCGNYFYAFNQAYTFDFEIDGEFKEYVFIAQWDVKIKLMLKGSEVATQIFKYGKQCYINSIEVNPGYDFGGWKYANESKIAGPDGYIEKFTILNTDRIFAIEINKKYTITLSTPYTLSGSIDTYTVQFNLNGASGTAPAAQTTNSTNAMIYPTIPVRSGHAFAGWYTTSACTGAAFDFSVGVFSNYTLYAKWIALNTSYTSTVLPMNGNTGNVAFNSTINYYAFVPLVSQTITIFTSHTSGDPYLYLYNASLTQLTYNDDGNGNSDAKIAYSVTAGTLYHIGFKCWSSSSGTGTMYLSGQLPLGGGRASAAKTVPIIFNQPYTLPTVIRIGYIFEGWYGGADGTGTQYTDKYGTGLTVWNTPADTKLYPKLTPITYTVNYYSNNTVGTVSGSTSPSSHTYDIYTNLTANGFTKTGCFFLGWNTTPNGSGVWYANSQSSANLTINHNTSVSLYAQWMFTITFDKNGGYGGTSSILVTYGSSLPNIDIPQRPGYEFTGYYTTANGGNMYYYDGFTSAYYRGYAAISDGILLPSVYEYDYSDNLKLYANWKFMEWTVSVYYNSNEKGSGILEYGFSMKYDQSKSYPVPELVDHTFSSWSLDGQFTGNIASGGKVKSIDLTNQCRPYDHSLSLVLYYTYSPSCVAEGTLITLADGSQVPVEQLTGNEMLLVWNMYTGTFDSAPILFIDSDPGKMYEVIYLYFNDGSVVKVISEHAFWDLTLNKYVYLDNNASQYIGHWFSKQDTKNNGNIVNRKTKLIDVVIVNEYTTAWSPVTFGHLCYYVNGMLSMPGGINGFINIFEVDAKTMTIDRNAMLLDIETYGLFTYEEFAEIFPIPEIIYEAFGGDYLKVAIGKGLIDLETIGSLIERYAKFFEGLE